MQRESDIVREDFIGEGRKLIDRLAVEIEKRKPSYFRKTIIRIRKIVSAKPGME